MWSLPQDKKAKKEIYAACRKVLYSFTVTFADALLHIEFRIDSQEWCVVTADDVQQGLCHPLDINLQIGCV